jgi:hypothetical protein
MKMKSLLPILESESVVGEAEGDIDLHAHNADVISTAGMNVIPNSNKASVVHAHNFEPLHRTQFTSAWKTNQGSPGPMGHVDLPLKDVRVSAMTVDTEA